MKTIMRGYILIAVKKYTLIILLLIFGANLYAGEEIFNSGNYTVFTETNAGNHIFSDKSNLNYNLFYNCSSEFDNPLLKSDRPGIGDGIGVTPVSGGLWILLCISIVYGLRAKYRHTKIKKIE